MEGFNLNLSKPDFGLDNIADFIHNVGQGVPKDTKYSVMVPMYLDLKLVEMRMQLRDYPLPILYSPRNKNTANASLILRGDLVISEKYVTDEKEIRKLEVPLVASHKNEANPYDLLTIEKHFQVSRCIPSWLVTLTRTTQRESFGELRITLVFNNLC